MGFQFLFINGTSPVFSELEQRLAEPFDLTQVTFASDVNFSVAEFNYLTGLFAGMQADATTLKMACFYLDQRKIFAKIQVLITSDHAQGKKVHFNLIGYPCLGGLKIEGLLFGKERYLRLYGLERGARFEYARHQAALHKIFNELRNDGYLNAQVRAEPKFNQDTKLVDINLKIKTNQRFKIQKVVTELHVNDAKISNPADLTVLQAKIEKLLASNLVGEYYASVALRKELAVLKKYLSRHGYPFSQMSFTVLKNPVTSKIKIKLDIFLKEQLSYNFAGNNFYNKHELIDYIMFAGDPIWRLPINLVEKDLVELYHKNGFWRVQITGVQAVNNCHFAIDEGARARIQQVTIKDLDLAEQKQVINHFFKKKIIGKYYHKKTLDQVLEKLSDWYVQKGFWDFRILNIDFKCLNESKQNYELVLTCHQGKCRFLRSATVLNYPNLKIPGQLVRYKAFKIKDLQLQKAWLVNYFKQSNDGQISAYPDLKEQAAEQAIDVDVIWEIKFVAPSVFGKTIRHGNAEISFNKLYQNLPYQVGDLWDQSKLDEALFRVKNLDVFDSVRVYPLNITDPLGQKPLVLDLNLDHKLEVRTRLGFQKVSKNFAFKAGTTYKIGMSALYKNVTACGDQFRFDADLTKYYRSIVLQYKRPIFINMPLYFVTKTYSNKYDQPIFIGSKYRLYNVLQQGGLVDIGYKSFTLNTDVNLGIEGIEVSNISHEYARAIDFSDKLLCKQVPFLFIEPTILLDQLDDKLNPRSGMLTLATGKTMIAISQTENYFFKFLLEQSVFIPVFNESVFAIRLRLGHIFTNDFNVIMPIERFYLGGTYSLRSYEPDMAPPLGRAILDKNNSQADACKKTEQPALKSNNPFPGYAGQAMVSDFVPSAVAPERRLEEIVSNHARQAELKAYEQDNIKNWGHPAVSGEALCEAWKLVEGSTSKNQRVIWLPQGGKSMVNISFEFRFPIYKNFGGVIFEDLGTLLRPGENLGQNKLLTATGFGLRYHTPIGPLRFDIGWRPRNFAWFLTIGHAF